MKPNLCERLNMSNNKCHYTPSYGAPSLSPSPPLIPPTHPLISLSILGAVFVVIFIGWVEQLPRILQHTGNNNKLRHDGVRLYWVETGAINTTIGNVQWKVHIAPLQHGLSSPHSLTSSMTAVVQPVRSLIPW